MKLTTAPKVIWWRDGVLWDSESDPSTYEEVLQNTLVISALGLNKPSMFLTTIKKNCPESIPPNLVFLRFPIFFAFKLMCLLDMHGKNALAIKWSSIKKSEKNC